LGRKFGLTRVGDACHVFKAMVGGVWERVQHSALLIACLTVRNFARYVTSPGGARLIVT